MQEASGYTILSQRDAGHLKILGIAHTHSTDLFSGSEELPKEKKLPQEQRDVIKKNTHWNDIILIEGWPAEKRMGRLYAWRKLGIPFKLRAYGWDDMYRNETARRFFQEADALHRSSMSSTPGEDPINVTRRVQEVQPTIEQLTMDALKLAIERNPSLTTTINALARRFKRKRIVVLAGSIHFTYADPHGVNVMNTIAQYPHAVLNFSSLSRN